MQGVGGGGWGGGGGREGGRQHVKSGGSEMFCGTHLDGQCTSFVCADLHIVGYLWLHSCWKLCMGEEWSLI